MKKTIAVLLVLSLALPLALIGGGGTALAVPEIVAGGYELDMDNIPAVRFEEHKNWERLYDQAWQFHKFNIKKATIALNPENVYYVDEAFDNTIFAWDTMFMMMFDKYGYSEFPTLQSLDNFYYHQVDTGDGRGFIPRRINESNGSASHAWNNINGTNPPLWGWAEWEQYLVHGDVTRFTKLINGKTILQRLDDHFQFIKRVRVVSSGLYTTSGDGNGLDNTPNAGTNQTYNDLSLQMYQFAEYIKLIADEVGDQEMSDKYAAEIADHYTKIQQKLWSEAGSYFFNLNSAGTAFTNIVTPTGLWALAAGVATPQQARRMVEAYALNSEKLFRPQGLSTVTYDYSSFKPTGGYWNGAMWSPTSFQYIKGLERYGYNDLAFREAVRHINALSRVYEKGAYDRNGAHLNTIWENYSSEWDIPGSTENSDGQPSRTSFVGWSGALAVGCIIEDVIGIRISARDNEVDWNLNLTEGHGIDNLWMAGNVIDVYAQSRPTATSATTITVKAAKPFTLNVKNGTKNFIFNVAAGVNTFTVEGEDSGAGAYLGGIVTGLNETNIAPAQSDSYVFFGSSANSSVNDGLRNQTGVNPTKDIYNVNTIGYRDSTVRKSDTMSAKLGADAYEYVKTARTLVVGNNNFLTPDGFMIMAKAGVELKTLKLILGVRNAKATINAELSDASVSDFSRTVTSDLTEKEFVVEIPFKAASAGNYILVKYTLDAVSEGGYITLKGVMLDDGGTYYPPRPAPIADISLASADSALIVSSGQDLSGYDSFVVYYGLNEYGLHSKASFDSLPANLGGLTNYTRYYIAVAGVKGGVESDLSPVKSEVPEAVPLSNGERALSDWEAAKPIILNGNAGFDDILSGLNFNNVIGPIYGSTFKFSVSTNAYKNGVQPNGQIIIPTKPQPDAVVYITVEITCGDSVVTVVQKTVVKADENSVYVYGQKTRTSGSVNLTTEGTVDWLQFYSSSITTYAKKNIAAPVIQNIRAIGATSGPVTDAPFTFTYSDAAPGGNPQNNRGIQIRGEGNGYEFSVPYRNDKMQNIKVYSSVWGGDLKLEFLVNGIVMYTDSFGKTTASGMLGQCFDIDFHLSRPTDVATVRIICTLNLDNQWGGAVNCLQAVTLSDSDKAVPPPDVDTSKDEDFYLVNTAQPTAVNLTREGSKDWFLFNNASVAGCERKLGGKGIGNVTVTGNNVRLKTDNNTATFSWTDGTIAASGSYARGIVLERTNAIMTYILPYSPNRQQMNIYFGVWSARALMKAEVMKGQEVIKTVTDIFDTGLIPSGATRYSTYSLNYLLDDPDEYVKISFIVDNAYDASWGSVNVGAITLAETLEVSVDADVTNGILRVTPNITTQGTIINVFATPESKYLLTPGSMKYITDSGREVAIDGASFIMPDENVTVTAAFERIKLPVTSIRIDAPPTMSVKRGEVINFNLILNEDANTEGIVWSVSNPIYATVDDGVVKILNKTGTVTLTVTAPTGVSYTMILRIV